MRDQLNPLSPILPGADKSFNAETDSEISSRFNNDRDGLEDDNFFIESLIKDQQNQIQQLRNQLR